MMRRSISRCIVMVLLLALVLPGIARSMPAYDGSTVVAAAPGEQGKHAKPDKDKPDKPGKPDKDKDKDKPGKDKDKNKGNGKQIDPPQSTTESYVVDLTCSHDAATDRSTCVATGTAPDGASPIADLLIDTTGVCAPVVGGSYLLVPPTEGSEIDGYGALGDTPQVVLVFDSTVTVGSTATYWLSIDGAWVPAAGPGLVCSPSTESATTPEATETPATGSIVATFYACPAPPQDDSEPDWFGTCHVMDSTLAPTLVDTGTAADVSGSGEATAAGQTTWGDLGPGNYTLSVPDATWCHAESDNVDAESNLIVEGGATTSVWLFFCSAPETGS